MELVDFVLESPYEDESWEEMAADALPAFDEVIESAEIAGLFGDTDAPVETDATALSPAMLAYVTRRMQDAANIEAEQLMVG